MKMQELDHDLSNALVELDCTIPPLETDIPAFDAIMTAISVIRTLKAELPNLNFTLLLPAEKCELCLTEQATINHLCQACDEYLHADVDELMFAYQEEDSAILCPACFENIDSHDDSRCDFMQAELDRQAWRDEQMNLLLARKKL